ncbi:MAG: GH16 [uncultured Rubrobacteraceae bacterium]|uniref:Beta-glucanase n=1 Tax=uncultured Rubrobacteraceae bacterium TaxID=349277 RepID=A0A6J4QVU7_9ACTN|nr:MAG: GH16 [uncultured Rubrobacteraceae bacterium]
MKPGHRMSSPASSLLALLTLFVVLALSAGCGDRGGAPGAEISVFEPPRGQVSSGDPAEVLIRVRNTGPEAHTFFVGYSVRDAAGEWLDAPVVPVELEPGAESGETTLVTPPLETPGPYAARVSVWSEAPGGEGEAGAERLAEQEKESAFRVSGASEEFAGGDALPAGWKATERKLGRGRLLPENVSMEAGKVRLKLPANAVSGGEIESEALYGPGSTYTARMKVPDAPSSITGFFLYEPPDLESEIDIEVFNEPSGRILFTTYADGKQTHTKEKKLPFDPTEDFHDYGFFYGEDSVVFYVDGEEMQRFGTGIPTEKMQLYVNSWYPTWLQTRKPASDRYTYIEWIEH